MKVPGPGLIEGGAARRGGRAGAAIDRPESAY